MIIKIRIDVKLPNIKWLRKFRKFLLSLGGQDEVGKLVGVHGAVIGRYERDEVKPSIEMATQLAEALEVSLDYLVGSTDTLLEKSILNRVLDIQKLKDNDKQHVFALLDAFIKQTKFQSIM